MNTWILRKRLNILKNELSRSNLENLLNSLETKILTNKMKFKINETMIDLIQKCSEKYIEFWGDLKGDNICIQKVYSSLKQSQKSIKEMNVFWETNPILDDFNLKSKYLYGKFLTGVLNCKEEGDAIVEDFGIKVKRNARRKGMIQNIDVWNDLEFISQPVCLIEQLEVIFLFF